jgi:hypothetical protein
LKLKHASIDVVMDWMNPASTLMKASLALI